MKYNTRHHYAIISIADSEDIYESTVYKQLHKIQLMYFKYGLLEIDCVYGHQNKSLKKRTKGTLINLEYDKKLRQNIFIYKLRITVQLQQNLAEVMNLKVFNARHNFQTFYDKRHKKEYEPFRDTQKQQMIMNLLSEEFDIFNFEKIGLVIAHFPLHHFRYRNYIKLY